MSCREAVVIDPVALIIGTNVSMLQTRIVVLQAVAIDVVKRHLVFMARFCRRGNAQFCLTVVLAVCAVLELTLER